MALRQREGLERRRRWRLAEVMSMFFWLLLLKSGKRKREEIKEKKDGKIQRLAPNKSNGLKMQSWGIVSMPKKHFSQTHPAINTCKSQTVTHRPPPPPSNDSTADRQAAAVVIQSVAMTKEAESQPRRQNSQKAVENATGCRTPDHASSGTQTRQNFWVWSSDKKNTRTRAGNASRLKSGYRAEKARAEI